MRLAVSHTHRTEMREILISQKNVAFLKTNSKENKSFGCQFIEGLNPAKNRHRDHIPSDSR